MKKNKTQFITKTALVAAAYVAITFMFSSLSYGQVQFRLSEILVLFAFLEPKYSWGLLLGCFLANSVGPFGIIDAVVGTSATLIAILFIIFVRQKMGDSKNALLVASLGPVVSNAVIIGVELNYLLKLPFAASALYVAAGEFVVVTIVGTIIIQRLMQNQRFIEKIKM